MPTFNTAQKMHYTLRVAVAMCFIGHGAFGIITKAGWVPYFGILGIGNDVAYRLMPPLGIIDILMGLIVLLFPLRAIPLWLIIWGLFTAFLRPLAGEPLAEFVERAGNYGAPAAMLLLSGFSITPKNLFSSLPSNPPLGDEQLRKTYLLLRIVVFMLLAGHGWLNLLGKQGLLNQYAAAGFSNPMQVARFAGIFEVVAAFAILIKPIRPLLMLLFFWKIATELLYPNWMIFEWIERGGSYGSILALWFAMKELPRLKNAPGSRYSVLTN